MSFESFSGAKRKWTDLKVWLWSLSMCLKESWQKMEVQNGNFLEQAQKYSWVWKKGVNAEFVFWCEHEPKYILENYWWRSSGHVIRNFMFLCRQGNIFFVNGLKICFETKNKGTRLDLLCLKNRFYWGAIHKERHVCIHKSSQSNLNSCLKKIERTFPRTFSEIQTSCCP